MTEQLILEQIKKLSSHEDTASWIVERESRIVRYNNEALAEEKSRFNGEIKKLQERLKAPLVTNEDLIKKGFHYYRPLEDMEPSMYGLAKKVELNITHFLCGRQIYPLPDDKKILNYKCYLVFYFNHAKDNMFCRFGLIGSRFGKIRTFHTGPTSICLNGQEAECSEGIDIKNPDTLIEASKKVLEILTTINPYSYLYHFDNDFPQHFRPAYDYVNEKRRQQRIESRNNSDWCNVCDHEMENCECDFCEYCDGNRDAGECECGYCEDHDRDYLRDDGCPSCEWCPQCSERMGSRHYENCECSTCSNCGSIEHYCECSDGFQG